MKKISVGELIDNGICPTCYDREHDHCVFGCHPERTIFENDRWSCFFEGMPRAQGHVIISSKQHYKDMMDAPQELCRDIFLFAQRAMRALKEVYGCESVYLCTMCDGPMNHFHLQLIPRYQEEKRGSRNFVKERREYIHREDLAEKLRAYF